MKQLHRFTKTIAFLVSITICSHSLQAQELQDKRMVGILAFATNKWQDSIAARNIYAAVSRVLIQTKRFTVIEIDKWSLTQDEIERQRKAGFLERDVIQQGKSLGAQILIVGFVKNVETYQNNGKYAARVDYELKYIEVETGKSIAAGTFTGDSENFNNTVKTVGQGLGSLPFYSVGYKNYKTLSLAGSALTTLSETEKHDIQGKTIDAIEESADRVNAWVHKTFNFSLLLLQAKEDEKKKGVVQEVLVEGGEDIGMKKGFKLKMVLVTDIETPKGKIRDEEPVAELQVDEVRAETSKCTVTKGGKRIQEASQNKNMRIVFN